MYLFILSSVKKSKKKKYHYIYMYKILLFTHILTHTRTYILFFSTYTRKVPTFIEYMLRFCVLEISHERRGADRPMDPNNDIEVKIDSCS